MNSQFQYFKEQDYKRQKAIFSSIFSYLKKNNLISKIFSSDEANPIKVLEKYESEFGINEAYKSVKIGIHDFLEMTKDFTSKEVNEIDEILKSKKLETLTQLRDKNFKKIKNLIQKKEIKSAEDYYLLSNIINNENYFTLNESYTERINYLINKFEERKDKL
jgi:hypothetical protein